MSFYLMLADNLTKYNVKQTPKRKYLGNQNMSKNTRQNGEGKISTIVKYSRNITFSILSRAFTHILGTKMRLFGVCFILYVFLYSV